MAYRHCPGCGRAFDQKTWRQESFCSSCGEPLKRELQRDEPLEIHPYPDHAPVPMSGNPAIRCITTLKQFAVLHPYIFSVGAIAAGIGAIMLGPYLIVIGKAAMAIGAVLAAAGMVGAVYGDSEEGAELIGAGLMALLAGTGLALLGYVLTAAGIVAVVTGTGVGGTAITKEFLRRRLIKRIRENLNQKSLPELLAMSNTLQN